MCCSERTSSASKTPVLSENMRANHVGVSGVTRSCCAQAGDDQGDAARPALQRAAGSGGGQVRGLPVEVAQMQGCRAGGARRAETHEWRRMERGEPVSETLVLSLRTHTVGEALLCAAIFSIRKYP